MAEPVQEKIIDSLNAAEGLYHRLVLLVGSSGSGKTAVLQGIASKFGTKVVNVNLELCLLMLEMTERKRALGLTGLLDQIIGTDSDTVVLDNLEILFDVDLKQDPLRLLQGISRNKRVVASWSGTTAGGKLIYAEPGHPEYRNYEIADLVTVSMGSVESEFTLEA
jgi:hypothetical protein